MEDRATHRNHPLWRPALDAAEQVSRLVLPITAKAPWCGELLRKVHRLPVVAVQPGREEALEELLLEIEAALLLALRLEHLREPQVAAALKRLDEVRGLPAAAPSREAPPRLEAVGPPPASPPLRAAATSPEAPAVPTARTDYLLLDGCNFLGRAPGYDLGDESSRDRLLFRLQEYAREHPAHRVVVFFDGKRASSRVTAGVEERISSGLHTADDVMVDYVRALPREDRRRTTLVTDDRELSARARREGVRAESVQWLTARLVRRAASSHQKSGLSRSELSEWEQFFNEPPRRPGKP